MFAARSDPAPAVEVVRGIAGLEALQPEWEALWRRSDATPFQHPAWLLPWARTHAQDRAAAVLLREQGALRAVLPVFTWAGDLHLAGAGPSDYAADLFAREAADAAADLLAAAAAFAAAESCAAVRLPQLRPGSALLAAPAPPGWRDAVEPGEVCPVAPLLGPEGLDAVPPLWRRKLAYARRKVARAGVYTVETAARDTLAELWSALEIAHAARWRARGQEGGVLADDLLLRFLREAAPELQAAGLLRLHGLRLEGRIVAALFALHDRDRAHGYMQGFDPALGNLGLGSILVAHAMTSAAAEGLTEFHFLRGQEPYKYAWGAADTSTFNRELTRAGPQA